MELNLVFSIESLLPIRMVPLHNLKFELVASLTRNYFT